MSIKIVLTKMGMDLRDGDERWDMASHRVRPRYDGAFAGSPSDYYLKLKDGEHYVVGDFCFWRKNKTNNKEGDRLSWDFTMYDKSLQDSRAFRLLDHHTERIEPTLKNIAKLLGEIMGEEVEITGVED